MIDTVQSIYQQTHFYAAGMKTVEVRQEMKACIEALTQFVQMDIECKLELAALSSTHDTSAEPVKLIRTLTPLIMSTDSASMANLIAYGQHVCTRGSNTTAEKHAQQLVANAMFLQMTHSYLTEQGYSQSDKDHRTVCNYLLKASKPKIVKATR